MTIELHKPLEDTDPFPLVSMTTEELKQFCDRLNALSFNAYLAYTEYCRSDPCLGEVIKLELGTFKQAELDAHRKASEWLGMHRAYARILNELKV